MTGRGGTKLEDLLGLTALDTLGTNIGLARLAVDLDAYLLQIG